MSMFIVIIVLIALAFPVIAIIALVQASSLGGVVRRLELRVIDAGARCRGLGRRLPPAPPPASAPWLAPVPTPPPPAPAVTPTEPAAPPPVPPAAHRRQRRSTRADARAIIAAAAIGFEERFGTRWVVWVGGVALALGGIFLVRYTIQQGLIGPGVRIMLGALLALVLVAAGEWTRRKENLSGLPGLPTAHIPGILTAAGTTVAYATVYAAYALYGFLPPGARVRSDGHRGAADAHGRAAARPGARRARRHRRVSGAAPGQHRATGLLGALHLHRRRHCGVVRAGALADVALARARRDRAERRLDAARHGAVVRSRRSAPTCSTRLPALRSPRSSWCAVCCTVRRPSRAKSIAYRCSHSSVYLAGGGAPRAGKPARSRPRSPSSWFSPSRPSPLRGARKPRAAPCRSPRSSPWR